MPGLVLTYQVVRNRLMERGFVLTITRSYSNVLMTTLLVNVCAFILLTHVKSMHMHAQVHIQKFPPSPPLSEYTCTHTIHSFVPPSTILKQKPTCRELSHPHTLHPMAGLEAIKPWIAPPEITFQLCLLSVHEAADCSYILVHMSTTVFQHTT